MGEFRYSRQKDMAGNVSGHVKLIENGKCVAHIGFYARGDGVINLAQDNDSFLFVEESRRRQGLGTKISKEATRLAIEEVKQLGKTPLKIVRTTAEGNIPAQKLLISMGYSFVSKDHMDNTHTYELIL